SLPSAIALPPRATMPDATSSASDPVRLLTTTSAPAVPSASAYARPIPRPAPVTTIALPSTMPAIRPHLATGDRAPHTPLRMWQLGRGGVNYNGRHGYVHSPDYDHRARRCRDAR